MLKSVPMTVTLKQIKVFLAVAQEQSVTSAAERLHLSKPAVSTALSEMERLLDKRLFDRLNNRLHLNAQGRRLLPLASELLVRSEEIEGLLSDVDPLAGALSIGGSHTIGNHVLPYLLGHFRAETGHKKQTLEIANTSQIVTMLLGFELDLAFVEGRVDEPDLVLEPWHEDEMVVLCAPDNPLNSKRIKDFGELNASDWLLREPGSGTREFFLQNLAPKMPKWHCSFELNSHEAIINAVTANLGYACLSKLSTSHALEEGRVCQIHVPGEMHRQYWLLYHQQKYMGSLQSLFLDFSRNWSFEIQGLLR
ncbi:LysR substrate-binding domain-containing protein [Pseudovibrio exalbescens]|uniref:LysR substrate-binding domain-containing protein n=1 Tax=Pseudovibrio exalbescens TaxID=197461 RepID=UPI00236581DF|nr:LysR substrate-binding domain-containing protein [Pseudovibrio exalbescens]MDD7911050.1 LysR substrate-binding domain-containing protein [Pseudovibrio exalbescens]